MIEKVSSFIKQHNLLQHGDRILVAVSGGADSVALLDVLLAVREAWSASLHVAHLNHMFRGVESVEDAFFVEALCREKGVPVTYAAINVPRMLKEDSGSAQEIARNVRYRFLNRVAVLFKCNKIAVAHHMNDQAETVLHNLLRGSGGEGLAGMPPRLGKIVRPLLAVGRSEIEGYCRSRNLPWRQDPTNEKSIYRRNKIRIELIPLLEREYNPSLVPLLARTADILQTDNAFLDRVIREKMDKISARTEQEVRISTKDFMELSLAEQRRLLRLAVEQLSGVGTGYEHVEKMLELVNKAQVGKVLMLPGEIYFQKSYRQLLLKKGQLEKNSKAGFQYHLDVPGAVLVPESGILLNGSLEGNNLGDKYGDRRAGYFNLAAIKLPLTVRSRKPGDRFFPLGAPGSKKLKDFLIDRKIPRAKRDLLPLVVDASGEIIWVVGVEVSNRTRITGKTRQVVKLKVEPVD